MTESMRDDVAPDKLEEVRRRAFLEVLAEALAAVRAGEQRLARRAKANR